VLTEGLTLALVEYFSLVWIGVSFAGTYRFKVCMIPMIGVGAEAWLQYFLLPRPQTRPGFPGRPE
jgi:hypothetical protein